jgi:hypothetical protein
MPPGAWEKGAAMAGFGRGRVCVLVTTLALATVGLVGWLAAPAGAVSTEAQLRSAFANPSATAIDLDNDIVLSDCTSNFGEVTRVNPTTALTLDGHGHTVTQTCPTAGVFGQNGDFPLTFQNVAITGGNQDNDTTCYGGAIRTSSPVTVINSTISGNSAACSGGGISVGSSLTVTNSTIRDNTAGGEGGGIFQSDDSGSLTVTNSTISGNSTTQGNAGGGIRTFGTATLTYTTVADNSSPDGANVSGYSSSTITMFGSVVAYPQGGGTDCAGPSLNSSGFNWDDDGSCGFTSTGDHSDAGDPHLAALANNGGPTQTRAPQFGSGLVDAIPLSDCQDGLAAGIIIDQRGFPRPSPTGGACDIGAVEVQPQPPFQPGQPVIHVTGSTPGVPSGGSAPAPTVPAASAPAAAPASVAVAPKFTG